MGPRIRVIVATHKAQETPARIGTTRDGMVYELFLYLFAAISLLRLPMCLTFTCTGAVLRPLLSDEDKEQNFRPFGALTPPMVRSSGKSLLNGLELTPRIGASSLSNCHVYTEFAKAEAVCQTSPTSEAPPGEPKGIG